LEIINQKTVHGHLNFFIRDGDLYFLGPKEAEMEELPVNEIQFRWEYAPIDPGVESLNLLYVLMKTDRGTILLTQELYPWESLHSDWQYKILNRKPDVDYRVDKGLTDLKRMIEKKEA